MNLNICLLLNGKYSWYRNIISAFERHGETWVQQSLELKSEHTKAFLKIIDRHGFFLAFGYVQRPLSAIGYVFKIDKMLSGSEKIPPPDDTVPPFDPAYDLKQGKCKDADDFKYQTWLHVMGYESIEPPIELSRFRKLADDKPYKLLYGRAHYYSTTPEAYRMKEDSGLEARSNIPRPIDSSAVETPPKAELSSIKQLELEPEYPLSQCETDTGFAESILARWVRVIK
jgi:hypothetical protein